jgi:hypothetical protein
MGEGFDEPKHCIYWYCGMATLDTEVLIVSYAEICQN